MKKHFYKAVENTTEAKAFLVLVIFLTLRLGRIAKIKLRTTANWLYGYQFYIFPLLAFTLDYLIVRSIIPDHPIAYIVSLGTASLAMLLTIALLLFNQRHAHWVKSS